MELVGGGFGTPKKPKVFRVKLKSSPPENEWLEDELSIFFWFSDYFQGFFPVSFWGCTF